MADTLMYTDRWHINAVTPQRQKLAVMLAAAGGVWALMVFAIIFLTYIVYQVAVKRPTRSPKNDPSRSSSNDSGAFTPAATGAALTVLASSAAFSSVLAGSLLTLLTTSSTYLVALLPLIGPLVGLFIASLALVSYSQTLFPIINTLNLNWIRPGFDYFINPILTLILVIYQSVYGVWVTILRLIAYATYGPLLVLMQCSFDLIEMLLYDIGRFAAYFIYAIAFWVGNNPIFTEIPLRDTFLAIGQFLHDVWVGPVDCFCFILSYIVGGIGKAFNNVNLADALTNAVNFVLVLFTGLIVRPLINNEAPQVTRVYQLQSGTFVSLGMWLENVTTLQFDIWIYGGDTELLVKQVNGTAPLPTDDMKYLVFFLQSAWAEMFAHAANAFVALVAWEPLNLAFKAPQIFTLQGASVFTFEMLRNESLASLDGLSTVLDVAPICQNPGFSVNYGSLVSPLRALVWLIQAISDIIFGELYSLFAGQVPGLFLATYFLQQAPPLVHFELEVEATSAILGCILAYLDDATGKTLEGLLVSLIVWLPRIPFQILAFVRYILQTGQVSVLDSVDIAAFEQSLLQVSLIGEIFYQFQPGATAATCPNQVTFFCALGYGLQQFLAFLFEAIIIFFRSIINVLKVVVGGIASGTLAQVQPPDFGPMIDSGYAAACRIGVILGTFIPLDIPCMANELGFCQVREFPGQINSTISICMATFLCKVTNYLMVPIEILAIIIRYVVSFNFTSSSLVVMAVREVANIIIFRILSPVCPLAHFFDCIFDVLVGGGQKAATGFFCLITGALVFLFQTLGEIIVQILQWIINVIIFIFGGFTQADAAKVLLDLIIQFLTIVGTSIEKILLALLNLVLSVFFSILVAICRIINFFLAFSLTAQCNQLEASLNNVLGGGATNFFSPQYTNYKRRATTPYDGINANGCERTRFDKIEVFAIQSLDRIYTNYPSFRSLNSMIDIDAERSRLNMMSSDESCDINTKKRAATPDRYEQVMRGAFGPGVTDQQQFTKYLYENVQWEVTSDCYTLIKLLKDTPWDQVTPGDKVQVWSCIKKKMAAVGLANTFAPLSWLPEDMFYNFEMRAAIMGVGVARFTTVALNWASDRTVEYEMLSSAAYQDYWKSWQVDVRQYNETFRPYYPTSAHPTAYELAPLMMVIKNTTLQSYLQRNFPAIYTEDVRIRDPVLDPLQSMYTFIGEFAMNGLQQMKDQANATLHSANETSTRYADGQYASNGVYMFGHDLNNRTAIWLEFGDEAVAVYDTRVSTHNLYTSLAAFVAGMWEWGSKLGTLFQQKSILNNFKRTANQASATPFLLYEQYGQLKRVAAEKFTHNIHAMYRSAPAFQPNRPRTLVTHTVATLGELAARYMGTPVTEVPAWCIHFISQETGVPFDQVVTQQTNKTDLAAKCRDESWRASLHRIGVQASGGFWSDPLGFFGNLTRARTPLAQRNRDAVKDILKMSGDSVWTAYYILFGQGSGISGILNRVKDVQIGSSPSVATYFEQKRAELEQTHHLTHPNTAGHPGNNAQAGVPWQVTQLDYEMWKNHTQFEQHINTPAKIKAFFFDSGVKEKKDGGPLPLTSVGEWRHQFVEITSEYLYQDYDRHVMNAALRALKARSRTDGLVWEPRSQKYRRDLGMTPETVAVRINVELQGIMYDAEFNPREKRAVIIRHVGVDGSVTLMSDTFLNLTGILEKTCMSTSTWLCENCYFADQVVGLLITRAVYLFNYYTGYFITLTADTIPYLQYTFSDNATVISGNGTNSPWIPALNEPLGTFLQFSQDEIDNGLSLTLWLEGITGKAFPSIITDGPLATMLRNYTTQLDPLGQPFNRSVLLDILVFVEYRLGWRLLELIDTIVVYLEGTMANVGDYAVHHLAFCTYTVEIDCSQKQYSFAGGAIVALFWYLVAGVAAYFVLQPFQFALAGIYMMFILTFPFFHAVITYGWSLRCIAFPQCYFKDLWDLWVYTLYPKCLPTLGAFVSSANYTAETCFNRNNQWEWVNCQKLGFTNIFDSLTYVQLWLGEDLGVLANLRDLYAQLGLDSSTTIDFSLVPWQTDPVVYRNFGGCATLTLMPYIIAGLVLLVVGVVVAGTLITVLPSLIASLFLLFVSAIAFAYFAIVELDYSYVSRSRTETEEKFTVPKRPSSSGGKMAPAAERPSFMEVSRAAIATVRDYLMVRHRKPNATANIFDNL